MEEVILDCPECGDEFHDIIREGPQNVTVLCLGCQTVRNIPVTKVTTTTVPVIISDGKVSSNDLIELVTTDEIEVGFEFEHKSHRMLITQLQKADGSYVDKLLGHEVKNIHAMYYDTVTLHFSINEYDITKAYEIEVSPEFEVEIGMVLECKGVKAVVKTIKSDQNRTLHRGFLMARNVVRAFCDPAPTKARRGDRYQTRPRGLPLGIKSAGDNKTQRVKLPTTPFGDKPKKPLPEPVYGENEGPNKFVSKKPKGRPTGKPYVRPGTRPYSRAGDKPYASRDRPRQEGDRPMGRPSGRASGPHTGGPKREDDRPQRPGARSKPGGNGPMRSGTSRGAPKPASRGTYGRTGGQSRGPQRGSRGSGSGRR